MNPKATSHWPNCSESSQRQNNMPRPNPMTRCSTVITSSTNTLSADVLTELDAVLANLALAPAPPSGLRFATNGQNYDTRLTWQKGREADLAGYRVVWRATHQPFWERGLDVGLARELWTALMDWNIEWERQAIAARAKGKR